MITQIDTYFTKGCGRCERFGTPACAAQVWGAGVRALRRICRDEGLEEAAKWGHPCYSAHGRNIAIIGAFRGDFRLTFFKAALMRDPEGVLVKQGPNTQTAGVMVWTEVADVLAAEPVIRAYLREAVGYAKAGVVPVAVAREIVLPDELIEAMDADPELAEAFHGLTPGRQRSYAIVLGAAKKSETRVARIAKLRPKVLAGKGAQEY